ncbi:MAG: hypothetical protein D6815_04505 [Candidatus Dadabacteria bacterium]|nr:MAG: hypothetical protein D6815_04505 [Candidatus Dadabacteria bacterium]
MKLFGRLGGTPAAKDGSVLAHMAEAGPRPSSNQREERRLLLVSVIDPDDAAQRWPTDRRPAGSVGHG